jgi:ubiquinone/menaquinone biosynthesis C-methylase UbiE
MKKANRDSNTVEGFGDEWERFDQSDLDSNEQEALFEKYFSIFPWQELPLAAQGFDMGCGSGRWAKLAAQRVGTLHCIDPSSAIDVARRNLAEIPNCVLHAAGVEDEVLPDNSMDFGYSLGVLHHIPDTARGLRDCVRMLKRGAPFLLYLYYALDNRSLAYRIMWQASDLLRRVISLLPHGPRFFVSQLIAAFVYFPLARFAALMERLGISPEMAAALPLGFYRNLSFYTMRTDALDRFGTRLEQRFTRQEIYNLMESAGLSEIRFSESDPYWCAIGFKS